MTMGVPKKNDGLEQVSSRRQNPGSVHWKAAQDAQLTNGNAVAETSTSASTGSGLDLSGMTPEVEKKYKKLFDQYRPSNYFGFQLQAPLVWRSVYNLTVIHILGIIGCYLAFQASYKTLLFALLLHVLGCLGITAGAHRLWTHRSYKAHFLLRVALMIMDTLAFQNDILEWVRDHRTHHKYSETDADPHNAKRGFFFAHMGWLMMRKHPQVIIRGQAIDMSDVKADPVVIFQHRFFLPLGFLITFFLPAFIPWYCWNEAFFSALCICSIARYMFTLNVTWLVNSAAHMWGNKPYDVAINPSENMFVTINAMGEGFHNYHHTFPHDYSTSEFGPWFNLSTFLIDTMALLGLVWDRKRMSAKTVLARKKRTGELRGKEITEDEMLALEKDENDF